MTSTTLTTECGRLQQFDIVGRRTDIAMPPHRVMPPRKIARQPRHQNSDYDTSLSQFSRHSCTNMDRSVLHERLHSVLSHRLGLPLLYALHGEDPATLKYLGKKRALLTPQKERRLNGIFAKAIGEWTTGRTRKEPQLLKIVLEKIIEQHNSFHALNELKVEEVEKSDGHIDIIFSEAESKKDTVESTPLAVIEFGIHGTKWWKKLSHGVRYIDEMSAKSQQRQCVGFDKPLLLAIVTYDETCEGKWCEFRIGVFLCFRKNTKNGQNEYRMSLLWHTESNTLEDASNMFGRLLRVTSDFGRWRNNWDAQSDDGYEYFSSDCCKVGNGNAVVLRSYDSRVSKINRSPEVYLSPECRDIVGNVEEIVKIPRQDSILDAESENCKSTESKFWIKSKERMLLIISAPYRRGSHVAAKLASFVPIIDQLQDLHEKGFVHGDIRAFNTVFGEQADEGWLIDFDFGGKLGSTFYPKGYCRHLGDGSRLGFDNDEIFQWHDWFALGELIFTIHHVAPPEGPPQDEFLEFFKCCRKWRDISEDPSHDMINHLRKHLQYLDGKGYAVDPSRRFADELTDSCTGPEASN